MILNFQSFTTKKNRFLSHGYVTKTTIMCEHRLFPTHNLSVNICRYVFANKSFYPHIYLRVGKIIQFYLHIYLSLNMYLCVGKYFYANIYVMVTWKRCG